MAEYRCYARGDFFVPVVGTIGLVDQPVRVWSAIHKRAYGNCESHGDSLLGLQKAVHYPHGVRP